jgi:hypothetical protein
MSFKNDEMATAELSLGMRLDLQAPYRPTR